MAEKPLFVLLLNLATAWAQTGTGSSCLDPASAGLANKADCCAGSGNGQGDVGGVLFEYTCNSWADKWWDPGHSAENAFTCADLCRQEANCHASSWKANPTGSGENCWFSSAGFRLTDDKKQEWVILVNTERAGHVINPDPTPPTKCDCDEEVETAKEECTSEKEQLSQDHEKGCQDKLKIEIEKCESDKTLLEQSLKAECDKQIAALKPPAVPPPATKPPSPPAGFNAGSGTCGNLNYKAGDIVTFASDSDDLDLSFLVVVQRNFYTDTPPWRSAGRMAGAKTIEQLARDCDKKKCKIFVLDGIPRAEGPFSAGYYQALRSVTNADFPITYKEANFNHPCIFLRL